MALTLMSRRDPFAEFDSMIRRAFPSSGVPGRAGTAVSFRPAVDIIRDGDDAVINMDVPGVDFESDIDVEVDGSTLTISGERRDLAKADDDNQAFSRTLREVRYGTFRRSFTLPEHVGPEQIGASYDAGVLTIRVSHAYVTSEPRKIAVTAGTHPAGSETVSVTGGTSEDRTSVVDAD